MKVPNVLVLSLMGELCGICGERDGETERESEGVTAPHRQISSESECEAHHVISDVQTQGSGAVVGEGCSVWCVGRYAKVQHVVCLGW